MEKSHYQPDYLIYVLLSIASLFCPMTNTSTKDDISFANPSRLHKFPSPPPKKLDSQGEKSHLGIVMVKSLNRAIVRGGQFFRNRKPL